jgi:hypothetical protein
MPAMPMHDWTKVEAGIFHAFHHEWISEIFRALNRGLLPDGYYALPEQIAAGYGPDVLTLQSRASDERADAGPGESQGTATALRTRPRTRFAAQTEVEFYRRKKSSIVVRHASGDRIVAMIEIMSAGNKSSRAAFRDFVDKTCKLLEYRIHLLIVDPFPPGPRDPNGVHAAIWEQVQDAPFQLPEDEPLTLVSYECELETRAYIETVRVGQALPEMPLFLEPDGCVMAPLEATYETAFAEMPQRWRSVLEPESPAPR